MPVYKTMRRVRSVAEQVCLSVRVTCIMTRVIHMTSQQKAATESYQIMTVTTLFFDFFPLFFLNFSHRDVLTSSLVRWWHVASRSSMTVEQLKVGWCPLPILFLFSLSLFFLYFLRGQRKVNGSLRSSVLSVRFFLADNFRFFCYVDMVTQEQQLGEETVFEIAKKTAQNTVGMSFSLLLSLLLSSPLSLSPSLFSFLSPLSFMSIAPLL